MLNYNDRGYESSRHYLIYAVYDLRQTNGQLLLFRMRTGSFLSVLRLAQMGYVSFVYLTMCPFCRMQEPEDAEHILLRCEFASQRARYFFQLSGLNSDQSMIASVLLGGEQMGDEGIVRPVFFRGEPITLVTIEFLQSICEQRQRVIRSLLLSDLPPRADAQLGTVVLSQGTELAVPGGSPPQGVLVGRNPTYLELGSDL